MAIDVDLRAWDFTPADDDGWSDVFAIDLGRWRPDLHPRDSHGRFRNTWRLGDAARRRVDQLLSRFSPPPLRSDAHAASYLKQGRGPRSKKQQEALDYFLSRAGNEDIQSTLRAKYDPARDKDVPQSARIRELDGMMKPLEHDLILSRVMGPDAFGLPPENLDGFEEWTGQRVQDAGFSPMNAGSAWPVSGPHIEMRILVPKGTKAIIVGDGSGPNARTVILDRHQPVRVGKIQKDGRGGFYALATVDGQRGATGDRPVQELGRPLPVREMSPAIEATPEELQRRGMEVDTPAPGPAAQPERFGPAATSPPPIAKAAPAGAPSPAPTPAPEGPPLAQPPPATAIREAKGRVPTGAGRVTSEEDLNAPEAPTPAPAKRGGRQVIPEEEARLRDKQTRLDAQEKAQEARQARLERAQEQLLARQERELQRKEADIQRLEAERQAANEARTIRADEGTRVTAEPTANERDNRVVEADDKHRQIPGWPHTGEDTRIARHANEIRRARGQEELPIPENAPPPPGEEVAPVKKARRAVKKAAPEAPTEAPATPAKRTRKAAPAAVPEAPPEAAPEAPPAPVKRARKVAQKAVPEGAPEAAAPEAPPAKRVGRAAAKAAPEAAPEAPPAKKAAPEAPPEEFLPPGMTQDELEQRRREIDARLKEITTRPKVTRAAAKAVSEGAPEAPPAKKAARAAKKAVPEAAPEAPAKKAPAKRVAKKAAEAAKAVPEKKAIPERKPKTMAELQAMDDDEIIKYADGLEGPSQNSSEVVAKRMAAAAKIRKAEGAPSGETPRQRAEREKPAHLRNREGAPRPAGLTSDEIRAKYAPPRKEAAPRKRTPGLTSEQIRARAAAERPPRKPGRTTPLTADEQAIAEAKEKAARPGIKKAESKVTKLRAENFDKNTPNVPGQDGALLRLTQRRLAEGQPVAGLKKELQDRADFHRANAEMERADPNDLTGRLGDRYERLADIYEHAADSIGKRGPNPDRLTPGDKVERTNKDKSITKGTVVKRGRLTYVDWEDGESQRVLPSRPGRGIKKVGAAEPGAEVPKAEKPRTLVDLRKEASTLGVPGRSTMDREKLTEAIDARRKKEGESDEAHKARLDELNARPKVTRAAPRKVAKAAPTAPEAAPETPPAKKAVRKAAAKKVAKASVEDRTASALLDAMPPEARKEILDSMTPEERAQVDAAVERVKGAATRPVVKRVAAKKVATKLADLTPDQHRQYTDLSPSEQNSYRAFLRNGRSHDDALQAARDTVNARTVREASKAERALKKAAPGAAPKKIARELAPAAESRKTAAAALPASARERLQRLAGRQGWVGIANENDPEVRDLIDRGLLRSKHRVSKNGVPEGLAVQATEKGRAALGEKGTPAAPSAEKKVAKLVPHGTEVAGAPQKRAPKATGVQAPTKAAKVARPRVTRAAPAKIAEAPPAPEVLQANSKADFLPGGAKHLDLAPHTKGLDLGEVQVPGGSKLDNVPDHSGLIRDAQRQLDEGQTPGQVGRELQLVAARIRSSAVTRFSDRGNDIGTAQDKANKKTTYEAWQKRAKQIADLGGVLEKLQRPRAARKKAVAPEAPAVTKAVPERPTVTRAARKVAKAAPPARLQRSPRLTSEQQNDIADLRAIDKARYRSLRRDHLSHDDALAQTKRERQGADLGAAQQREATATERMRKVEATKAQAAERKAMGDAQLKAMEAENRKELEPLLKEAGVDWKDLSDLQRSKVGVLKNRVEKRTLTKKRAAEMLREDGDDRMAAIANVLERRAPRKVAAKVARAAKAAPETPAPVKTPASKLKAGDRILVDGKPVEITKVERIQWGGSVYRGPYRQIRLTGRDADGNEVNLGKHAFGKTFDKVEAPALAPVKRAARKVVPEAPRPSPRTREDVHEIEKQRIRDEIKKINRTKSSGVRRRQLQDRLQGLENYDNATDVAPQELTPDGKNAWSDAYRESIRNGYGDEASRRAADSDMFQAAMRARGGTTTAKAPAQPQSFRDEVNNIAENQAPKDLSPAARFQWAAAYKNRKDRGSSEVSARRAGDLAAARSETAAARKAAPEAPPAPPAKRAARKVAKAPAKVAPTKAVKKAAPEAALEARPVQLTPAQFQALKKVDSGEQKFPRKDLQDRLVSQGVLEYRNGKYEVTPVGRDVLDRENKRPRVTRAAVKTAPEAPATKAAAKKVATKAAVTAVEAVPRRTTPRKAATADAEKIAKQVELPKNFGEVLRQTDPEALKAEVRKLGLGDVEGDTGEEVFDNALKRMIQNRLDELGMGGKPEARKVAKAAPEAPPAKKAVPERPAVKRAAKKVTPEQRKAEARRRQEAEAVDLEAQRREEEAIQRENDKAAAEQQQAIAREEAQATAPRPAKRVVRERKPTPVGEQSPLTKRLQGMGGDHDKVQAELDKDSNDKLDVLREVAQDLGVDPVQPKPDLKRSIAEALTGGPRKRVRKIARPLAEPLEARAPAAPAKAARAAPNVPENMKDRVRPGGMIALAHIQKGDRVMVEQASDGSWHPSTKITATPITVDRQEIVQTQTRRGGQANWRILVGHDGQGNEISVGRQRGGYSGVQTFRAGRPEGAKVSKVAKAAPDVTEQRTAAIKKALSVNGVKEGPESRQYIDHVSEGRAPGVALRRMRQQADRYDRSAGEEQLKGAYGYDLTKPGERDRLRAEAAKIRKAADDFEAENKTIRPSKVAKAAPEGAPERPRVTRAVAKKAAPEAPEATKVTRPRVTRAKKAAPEAPAPEVTTPSNEPPDITEIPHAKKPRKVAMKISPEIMKEPVPKGVNPRDYRRARATGMSVPRATSYGEARARTREHIAQANAEIKASKAVRTAQEVVENPLLGPKEVPEAPKAPERPTVKRALKKVAAALRRPFGREKTEAKVPQSPDAIQAARRRERALEIQKGKDELRRYLEKEPTKTTAPAWGGLDSLSTEQRQEYKDLGDNAKLKYLYERGQGTDHAQSLHLAEERAKKLAPETAAKAARKVAKKAAPEAGAPEAPAKRVRKVAAKAAPERPKVTRAAANKVESADDVIANRGTVVRTPEHKGWDIVEHAGNKRWYILDPDGKLHKDGRVSSSSSLENAQKRLNRIDKPAAPEAPAKRVRKVAAKAAPEAPAKRVRKVAAKAAPERPVVKRAAPKKVTAPTKLEEAQVNPYSHVGLGVRAREQGLPGTVPELRQLAKRQGVPNYQKLRKDQLLFELLGPKLTPGDKTGRDELLHREARARIIGEGVERPRVTRAAKKTARELVPAAESAAVPRRLASRPRPSAQALREETGSKRADLEGRLSADQKKELGDLSPRQRARYWVRRMEAGDDHNSALTRAGGEKQVAKKAAPEAPAAPVKRTPRKVATKAAKAAAPEAPAPTKRMTREQMMEEINRRRDAGEDLHAYDRTFTRDELERVLKGESVELRGSQRRKAAKARAAARAEAPQAPTKATPSRLSPDEVLDATKGMERQDQVKPILDQIRTRADMDEVARRMGITPLRTGDLRTRRAHILEHFHRPERPVVKRAAAVKKVAAPEATAPKKPAVRAPRKVAKAVPEATPGSIDDRTNKLAEGIGDTPAEKRGARNRIKAALEEGASDAQARSHGEHEGTVASTRREVRAQARQRRIDRKRETATLLGEVEELLDSNASDRALIHRINSRAGVSKDFNKTDINDVRDRILGAGKDRDRMRAEVEKLAQEAGIRKIGSPRQRVKFDPSKHQPEGGGSLPAGSEVEVSRPGYEWNEPGGRLGNKIVHKAVVREAGPEAPTKRAPRKAVAKAVPEAPAKATRPRVTRAATKATPEAPAKATRPAVKRAAAKAAAPESKELKPLANGTRRKSMTNVQEGDVVRGATGYKGNDAVPRKVVKVERESRPGSTGTVTITRDDGSTLTGSPNTAVWLGEAPKAEAPAAKRAVKKAAPSAPEAPTKTARPRVTRAGAAAKKAAPEAPSTPEKNEPSIAELAKEVGFKGDAAGIVPSRQLDLDQGMSRPDLAKKIRRDATNLQKSPLDQGSSDPSVNAAARADRADFVAKLRALADRVEGKEVTKRPAVKRAAAVKKAAPEAPTKAVSKQDLGKPEVQRARGSLLNQGDRDLSDDAVVKEMARIKRQDAKDQRRLSASKRPALDQNVPVRGDPEGDGGIMHGDSPSMQLAQKLARRGDRNGSVNKIMEMRRSYSSRPGRDDLDASQKAVDELRLMRLEEKDPAIRKLYDDAIEQMDAEPKPVPDLPDGTPPAARQLLSDLNRIPLARREEFDDRLDRRVSSVDQLAEVYRDIDSGKLQSSSEIDSRIRGILHNYHESRDGAYQMWDLSPGGSDHHRNLSRELRQWAIEREKAGPRPSPVPGTDKPTVPEARTDIPDPNVPRTDRARQRLEARETHQRRAKADGSAELADVLNQVIEARRGNDDPRAFQRAVRERLLSTPGEKGDVKTQGYDDLRQSLAGEKFTNPEELETRLRQELAKRGIKMTSRVGAASTFNPDVHRSVGGDIPDNAPVEVIRPGLMFTDKDGKVVILQKPVVKRLESEQGGPLGEPASTSVLDRAVDKIFGTPKSPPRISHRSTQEPLTGDETTRLTGDLLTEDTDPRGIPVRDFTSLMGGGYTIKNGTAWRRNGVTYVVEHEETGEGKRAAIEAAKALEEHHRTIPAGARQYQRAYTWHMGSNPQDVETARKLGRKKFSSVASASRGDTNIWQPGVVMNDRGEVDLTQLFSDLNHEYGHNADIRVPGGNTRVSGTTRWLEAGSTADPSRSIDLSTWHPSVAHGGRARSIVFEPDPDSPYPHGVTRYGRSNEREDFAEAVDLYLQGYIGYAQFKQQTRGYSRVMFRDLFPERAAVLDQLFPEVARQQLAARRGPIAPRA